MHRTRTESTAVLVIASHVLLSNDPALGFQTDRRQLLQLRQIHLPTSLHHLAHQLHHLLAPPLHGLQYLRVIRMLHFSRFFRVEVHHLIRNQTKTEHRHPAVMRRQYLRHRRHTHGIGPQHFQHGAFAPALVLRPAHERVRAIQMQVPIEFQLPRHVRDDVLERDVVQIRRGRKSRSQLVVVHSHQRILPRQQRKRDVIANHGHVAHLELVLQSAGRVGHHDEFYAETSHDEHGQRDSVHVVSLVAVKSAAEAYRGDGVQRAHD
mmetsp:Transcript_11128/g.20007  ORF Transcript_11128/g.20007 Transcript_11128/m.20007 type:complete len:264 (+) Transcript_11128:354-1145(+)